MFRTIAGPKGYFARSPAAFFFFLDLYVSI